LNLLYGIILIQSFDSLTYLPQTGPADQPQFMACAEYKFARVSSPNVTADTARHTFTENGPESPVLS
jgi:hypothetical protein